MTDKKYLIDSNIIIYHLNGEEIATSFLEDNIQLCAISRLTFIEVLSFDYSEEEQKLILEYLDSFRIIDTNEKIALQAINNRKTKKIKIPDNIIASTAMVYNLTLVTRNIKDFKGLNIKILNIFKD